jgi:hypothetical protein
MESSTKSISYQKRWRILLVASHFPDPVTSTPLYGGSQKWLFSHAAATVLLSTLGGRTRTSTNP